jgi:hypothetical protein
MMIHQYMALLPSYTVFFHHNQNCKQGISITTKTQTAAY